MVLPIEMRAFINNEYQFDNILGSLPLQCQDRL